MGTTESHYPAPSRRAVLVSVAGASVAPLVSGCTAGATRSPGTDAQAGADGSGTSAGRQGAEQRTGFARPGRARVMQFVAHPDDDLFFMNPDTADTLASGVPVTTVYLTDGGSFGVNSVPGRPKPRPDVPAYVSSRQQGLRQAYAQMLGAPLFVSWERTTLRLPGGREAELDRLEHQGRYAELLFLNLRMHAKNQGRPVNMTHLWATPGVVLPAHPTPGSPVRVHFTYGRADLIETLVFLLRRYRPTLIRTLDPDPDSQVHDRLHPRASDQPGYSDHPDHTAAALFTWAALARWAGGSTRIPLFQTETYRGYYNERWPKNLPPQTVALKTWHLNAYGGDPSWECGNSSGCGDYSIGRDRVLTSKRGWVRSTHRRYPTAGPKTVTGTDGRTAVYSVLGTRLARWTGTAGGGLGDPEDLGGGPLAPSIAVVTTPDGRQLIFALRFSGLGASTSRNTREIVMLRQRTPGGDFKAGWHSLGNPETEPRRSRLTGPPAAVAGADGRVHVFVRNGRKGVSTRVLDADGNWSDWRRLRGGHIQEGLTVTVDGDGLIHLFASSSGWVEHWAQRAPSAGLRKGARRFVAKPGDVPDAVTAADGSVLVGYRQAAGGPVMVERLGTGKAGRWTTVAAVSLPGYGRVGLVGGREARAEELFMTVRAGTGAAQVYDGHGGGVVTTGALAVMVGTSGTLTVTGSGRAAVVALGLDAVPVVTQLEPGSGSV